MSREKAQKVFTAGTLAKWLPREKSAKRNIAVELAAFLGMSPRQYRKTLSTLAQTVENLMCSNKWDDIEFSKVPSVAASRYKKAFNRHTPKYAEYVAKLVSGDKSVKINAGAIFPHDVLKNLFDAYSVTSKVSQVELDAITAQWNALPNFVGDASILPIVDVSGSMYCPVGGGAKTQCVQVAISLGLYVADKNKGPFKDVMLTFSTNPSLQHLRGNIVQKVDTMAKSHWDMSTNLHAAINKILEVAVDNNVPPDEMPQMLLIMSDMQFNACVKYDDSAMQMIRRKYEEAGYAVPMIVFWNLRSCDNTPVRYDERGVALVSGYSPSILTSILQCDASSFTPEGVMLKAIMQDRYDPYSI